ncbi:hypothetical protein SUGI_0800860 [Cryptomeria japonica]|uniref:protein CHLOROPLAST ENHANCING STRESS TOLERANCE, chloroplastic n=1 Tax=Cryptomeria japonica TaxID=3369 RepID=UPI002414BE10|nr:protein CHLOROPLAST ENHANCING STRESS TOLERANCE, chloroplastic [Cryptomeria japonica]GLJ39255.1 hypothetical protein SUGI_0800860 [Cryptomeria japonica]
MALASRYSSALAGLQHPQESKWEERFIRRESLNCIDLRVASTRLKITNPQIIFSNKIVRIHGSRGYSVLSAISQGEEETDVQIEGGVEEVEDEEYIRQILRVVELLKEKRDMTFNEIRLTIMIEDPREAEQKRQLGIEDGRGCTREDMATTLMDVCEGRIPKDRVVLRELAKEMLNWPDLEAEVDKKTNPMASPYARVTDIGVDPALAAQRAKVDWDAATEIIPEDEKDVAQSVPPAVGFSILYLISAIPVIIGVSVVLILFLNSLQ